MVGLVKVLRTRLDHPDRERAGEGAVTGRLDQEATSPFPHTAPGSVNGCRRPKASATFSSAIRCRAFGRTLEHHPLMVSG